MARREREMNKKEEKQPCWGTLQELLLACAVNRYGPNNWETVSDELRRRISDHRHTPASCRRRYTDLRRRFFGDDVVDELKKLRVEELRREVKEHDVSIKCLKLKVKRLEEEREETDLSAEPEKTNGGEVGLVSGTEKGSLNESNSGPEREINEPAEPDDGDDEVPLAAKQIEIKCKPLIKILAILRAHKNGSVFERRLRTQESQKYKKLIRRHMDIQTVQQNLDKGFYLHSEHKFFRDLLLIFTNAIIYFPKNSNGYSAALELRKLVTIHMSKTIPKLDEDKKQSELVRTKPDKAPPPPIVVCRRRSSSGSKPSKPLVVAKTKEVEVKPKMKNPKFNVKGSDRVLVKKPGTNLKGNNTKKKLPDKNLDSSDSDDSDSDDDEEMRRGRNAKNGKRVGRRVTGREAEKSKLGKRGRPVKSPPPVAAAGRGVKRGKESGGVEDTGRMKKRLRR